MKDIESLKRNIFRFVFLGLALFSAFLFVSQFSSHLYHLSRYLGYAIGLTGLWIGLPLVTALFLSFFVLAKKPKWFNARIIFGALIVLLGISAIWAYAGLKGDVNFDLSAYNEAFNEHQSLLTVNELGGGLLGFVLASAFKATKVDALVFVFSIIIILLGLFMILFRWIKEFAKFLKNKKSARLSKKNEQESKLSEEKEDKKAKEEETQPIIVSPTSDFSDRPSLNFYHESDMSRIKETRVEEPEFNLPPIRDDFVSHGSAPEVATFVFDNEPSSDFFVKEEIKKEEPQIETPSIAETKEEPQVSFEKEDESLLKEEEIRIFAPEVSLPKKEEKEEEPVSDFKIAKARPDYIFPTADMLSEYDDSDARIAQEAECQERTEKINQVFEGLHIGARVHSYECGPTVSRFNIETDADVLPGVITKAVTKIRAALGGVVANYEETVLNSMYSALEIPVASENRRTVSFKNIFNDLPSVTEKTRMFVPFGEDISGKRFSASLAEFPHMLIAGTTKSGKSIYVNSIIMSLLMRNRPEDVKFVMVDPKYVEFAFYEELPHLLCPIITEPQKAKVAIEKLYDEMNHRNTIFRKAHVKNIFEYNAFAEKNGYERLAYIVFVVDEFFDLMSNCKGIDVQVSVLAAKCRSAGIHLIICTQRPSVDVIPGTLKSNLGVRVALSVKNAVDSTTILGHGGAENLAGFGDMLVDCAEIVRASDFRCQGCLVTNEEISAVCDFIRAQQTPVYDPRFLDLSGKEQNALPPSASGLQYSYKASNAERDDDMYDLVKDKVMRCEYYSMTRMNREFGFGYTRSGKIFQWLKDDGILEDSDNKANSKGCRVLIRINDESESAGSSDNSEFIENDQY